MKTKSTITDLPNDIRIAVPNSEINFCIQEIIRQAQCGEFHDFKNTNYACGKIQLVNMLRVANNIALEPIIEAVINGDYDESPDEEDKEKMKNDWLENGGTIQSYEAMFGK